MIIIANGRIGLRQMLDEIEAESKIWLETKGPADQVTETLRKLDGVTSAVVRGQEDGWASVEVQTRDNMDLREAIGMAVSSRGWALRRLERKRRRLEDAYFDVFRAQDPLKHDVPAPTSEAIQEQPAASAPTP